MVSEKLDRRVPDADTGRILEAMKRAGSFLGATAVFVAVAIAAAAQSPTPTPTPPPQSFGFLPCTGNCAIRAPCTPGTVCPNFVELGTCQVVADVCTCVSLSGTPGPTPTFGGCALTCDSRPCVGHRAFAPRVAVLDRLISAGFSRLIVRAV
jgi:hypothetical protein